MWARYISGVRVCEAFLKAPKKREPRARLRGYISESEGLTKARKKSKFFKIKGWGVWFLRFVGCDDDDGEGVRLLWGVRICNL